MAENKGWIKLYRNLLMNELWIGETFTKGQAWVDILLRVNHKDNKVLIGNQSIEVSKGQTIWSIKDMANRWKWSRKKVANFLKMLKREHQIDYKSTTKYTIVMVINWEVYQNELQEGTSNIEKKNIKGTSKEHQKNTNKNDKNVKNDKKNIYSDIFNHWNSKKIIVHRELTKEIEKAIEKSLKEYPKEEIFKAIDIYSEILNSEYYFNYKWTLKDFLNRKNGISSFMEDGSNKVNYGVWKEKDIDGAYSEHLKNRKKKTVL